MMSNKLRHLSYLQAQYLFGILLLGGPSAVHERTASCGVVMKVFLFVSMLVLSFVSVSAEACYSCRYSHGGYAGYGPYRYSNRIGYLPGKYGVMRPAWYGPYGVYPKLGFRAPVRRFFGFPGYTPIRQFFRGRGHIRRMDRRFY